MRLAHAEMFETLFIKPLFNALMLAYQGLFVHDLGIAVIVLVVCIRLLLWPLFEKAVRSQVLITKIQPQIQKIQKQYKDDPVRQSQELMTLYKESGFNPFMSVLVVIIQLPVLIALYRVFLSGIQNASHASLLYPWVHETHAFSTLFLSAIDLSKPFLAITILACSAQFFQSWYMIQKQKGGGAQAATTQAMAFISPILTFVILAPLPSVIGVYWITTTLFSIAQQAWVQRKVFGGNEK